MTFKPHSSYGVHIVDHLAANTTGLTGSDVAVVTLLQIYADLVCGFHLHVFQVSLLALVIVARVCHVCSPSRCFIASHVPHVAAAILDRFTNASTMETCDVYSGIADVQESRIRDLLNP